MSEKEKLYTIKLTISEYHENDEGFYNIKEDMETAKGIEQLKESVKIVKNNIEGFINRRINNGKKAI